VSEQPDPLPAEMPPLLSEIARSARTAAGADDTLRAIRRGEVDALVVEGPKARSLHAGNGRSIVSHARRRDGGCALLLSESGVVLYCNNRLSVMLRASRALMVAGGDLVLPEDQPLLLELIGRNREPCRGEVHLAPRRLAVPVHLSLTA